MKSCGWFKRIEAFVDGELSGSAELEAHLASCSACSAHRDHLLRWRAALRPETPVLSDAQFTAFMAGVSEGISRPRGHFRGFWALTSLAAAALVIALATFSIFDGTSPVPARADGVESASTDIDGATVEWGNSGGGVTTIWITIAEDDV